MPSEELSAAEIQLRITVPEFFRELADSHSASLLEQGDPEAIAAWRQARQLAEGKFANIDADMKGTIAEKFHQLSEAEKADHVADALKTFAKEQRLSAEFQNINPANIQAAYERIAQEQQDRLSSEMRVRMDKQQDSLQQEQAQIKRPEITR